MNDDDVWDRCDPDDPVKYYDKSGQQISMRTWVELAGAKYQARSLTPDGWSMPADDPSRVGLDSVGDITVSTVWLGLDHNFGDGPPLIFETMVFGGPDDQACERYPTEAAALAGHDRWVARQRHQPA